MIISSINPNDRSNDAGTDDDLLLLPGLILFMLLLLSILFLSSLMIPSSDIIILGSLIVSFIIEQKFDRGFWYGMVIVIATDDYFYDMRLFLLTLADYLPLG
jgi:hypothetical protein